MPRTTVLLEIMQGTKLREIGAMLGHRTAQMTQRYARLTEQHKSALVRKLAARVIPSGAAQQNCRHCCTKARRAVTRKICAQSAKKTNFRIESANETPP